MKKLFLVSFALFFIGCLSSSPTTDPSTSKQFDPNSVRSMTRKLKSNIEITVNFVPPGSFMMGSPENETGRDADETLHKVRLTKGFYMQTTEVTNAQWKAVMDSVPSRSKGCETCAVEQISWNDVQRFLTKINQQTTDGKYRLPTEAEWEYACRAGSADPYACGTDRKKLGDYAWYSGNTTKHDDQEVGRLIPNAFGLYDMHGNVWEFCQDWYGGYDPEPVVDPSGPEDGTFRVVRGGGWQGMEMNCRCANRRGNSPDHVNDGIGFRMIFEPF
jgi:formylglycine-generating enzyme required for sulfatase activity